VKVVALAGGTGAAKFLRGLVDVMPAADLTIVGNTGDDLEMWGLAISPDLDTVAYTLAGLVDEAKGWGVKHDSFSCRDAMAALELPTYFALGDRDLAVHLHRSERLRAGEPLSQVTGDLARRLRLGCRLIPMSDQRVATEIETPGGWLSFQEFFVRERCRPAVLGVRYVGAEQAAPAPGVIEAVLAAERVIICPSNPVSSIGPILAVAPIRRALAATRATVVGVSPIVGRAPVSGPAGKMMEARGVEVSAVGVAELYREWLDALLVDRGDADLAPRIAEHGVRALPTEIIMRDHAAEVELARAVLDVAL
jgi:LPPG:FO 2-phospho-L-lactate transferase